MECRYLPYSVDQHLLQESSQPRSMDPLVLLRRLPTLCTRDQHMHRHEPRRPLLIILLSEDHIHRNTKDHTSHATIKLAQPVLLQV